MSDFSTETWVLLALIAAAGLTAILHTLSRTFEKEQRVHDLKARVHELRRSYAKRLAEMTGREVVEVSPVDDPAADLHA